MARVIKKVYIVFENNKMARVYMTREAAEMDTLWKEEGKTLTIVEGNLEYEISIPD